MAIPLYAECPHKCNKGYLFNPYTKVKTPCPYCSEKRAKAKASGTDILPTGEVVNLSEYLRVPTSLIGTNFSLDYVLSDVVRLTTTQESKARVEGVIKDLIAKGRIGECPKCSMLFNIGVANVQAVIYAYLVSCYSAGLKVAPLLQAYEINNIRYDYKLQDSPVWGDKYSDYVNADICVVWLDTGSTLPDINAVAGLVEHRSNKGKSTIGFTTSWCVDIRKLYTSDSENIKHMFKLVSLDFKKVVSPTPPVDPVTSPIGDTEKKKTSSYNYAEDIHNKPYEPSIGLL